MMKLITIIIPTCSINLVVEVGAIQVTVYNADSPSVESLAGS
jgi:hypothetical protein